MGIKIGVERFTALKRMPEPPLLSRSDTTAVMIPLTLAGGFQDAYSYFVRGRVFANALTGNFVLMGHHFFTGDFSSAVRYLFPIAAFGSGVIVADQLRARVQLNGIFDWRHVVLAIEICLLTIVGLLPVNEFFNSVANVLTSFSCAMQVQAFRNVNGYTYASTMCIGNVRNGMEAVSVYLRTRERGALNQAWQYFLITVVFFVGAGLGGVVSMIRWIRPQFAIFTVCCVLLSCFVLLALPQKVKGEK